MTTQVLQEALAEIYVPDTGIYEVVGRLYFNDGSGMCAKATVEAKNVSDALKNMPEWAWSTCADSFTPY